VRQADAHETRYSWSRVKGKQALVLMLIGVAGLAAVTGWLLPPRPLVPAAVDWTPARPAVRGAYHVHTDRSDGSGSWEEVAEAAARVGLAFVIFTDHGNGTERREPPRYHAGVLCVDGVEISTWAGHYVVIPDHDGQSPYPLGGEARGVVEDARRFFGDGGVGIIAHPGSPRGALAWQDWTLPFDGLEWLNADSEWRDEGVRLGRTLLTYPFRPVETLAALVNRPDPVLAQWDRLTAARPVRTIAGHDAHARLPIGGTTDPYEDGAQIRIPSYDASLAAFSNHVVLPQPLTGDAAADARVLLGAIRHGAVYTTLDGLASPGPFEFDAVAGDAYAPMGEWIRAPLGAIELRARVGAPAGARLVILHEGAEVAGSTTGAVTATVSRSGAYRVEVYLPRDQGRRVPWLLSNPIYVDVDDRYAAGVPLHGAATDGGPEGDDVRAVASLADTASWSIETSPGSTLELEPARSPDGREGVRLFYTLAGGAPAGQYVALRLPAPGALAEWSHLGLHTSADRDARVWVQLRRPGLPEGERWGRSVAVRAGRHAEWLPLEEFRPLGIVLQADVPVEAVEDLLIVVDTVNTAPGTSGSFTLWDVRGGRP
jgi:hypothetical protein